MASACAGRRAWGHTINTAGQPWVCAEPCSPCTMDPARKLAGDVRPGWDLLISMHGLLTIECSPLRLSAGAPPPPSPGVWPHYGGGARVLRGHRPVQGGEGCWGPAGVWPHHIPVSPAFRVDLPLPAACRLAELTVAAANHEESQYVHTLCWLTCFLVSRDTLVMCVYLRRWQRLHCSRLCSRLACRMPNISARMVPLLQKFCDSHLAAPS